jgi:hypothetical protein
MVYACKRLLSVLKDRIEKRKERFELELKIGSLFSTERKVVCMGRKTEVNKKLSGAGGPLRSRTACRLKILGLGPGYLRRGRCAVGLTNPGHKFKASALSPSSYWCSGW